MSGDPDSGAVIRYFEELQARLCARLEEFEGEARFGVDAWSYGDGDGGDGGDGHSHSDAGAAQLNGRGLTRVIEGAVFEKGGVNFSHVTGAALPAAATAARPQLAGRRFEAAGVSVVMHPRNPFVPACHMNVRFFRAAASGGGDGDGDHNGGDAWWFGGGYDLTPYYAFDADCVHWHQTAKRACDAFDRGYYPKFKAACDAYFFLKHRAETRGIGGLFFDDFQDGGFARAFEFARAVGDSFVDAYAPIVARRRDLRYGARERAFQQYRRGRYAEFNLVFDRGTLFGLQSGGRVESILMSLPPAASWRYDWRPAPGSAEARLSAYLKPRDWLGESGGAAESRA